MQQAVAPIAVLMPNPGSPESRIMIPANHQLIAATVAFVAWTPEAPQPVMNGVAYVSTPHYVAIGVFFIRCKTGAALPDKAAAAAVNPFTCRLTAIAWSRILTSLSNGGAFNVASSTTPKFHDRIRSLAPDAALDISAGDWFLAPDLVTPNVAATRVLHDRIRFLKLMSLDKLEFDEPPFSISMPYTAFALLVLSLGPISSQASRSDSASDLYVTSELLLRDNVGSTDGAKATILVNALKGFDIPDSMRSHRATAANARLDAIDGLAYQFRARNRAARSRRR